MQDVEYVKTQLAQDNYTLLPQSEASGPVYKVAAHGRLDDDGFEVYFLYVPAGSSVLNYEWDKFVERYRFILGNPEKKSDGTVWKIGEGNGIKTGNEDAFIEVVRISKKYAPDLSRFDYEEILKFVYYLDNEAREMVINKVPKTYNPSDLIIITNKNGFQLVYSRPVLNTKQERIGKSYCYDFLDDSIASSMPDEELGKCVTLARLIKDTGTIVPNATLSKREILELWNSLSPEMINYNWITDYDPHFAYEPTQVNFVGVDGQTRIRINSLFIVKDVNGESKLCTYGPDHTFRNYFFDYLEDAKDFTLGWRENEDQILRLSDAAKAIGLNPPDLCPPGQVCLLWADVLYYLKNFTFHDENAKLWAPYSKDFTYEGTPR